MAEQKLDRYSFSKLSTFNNCVLEFIYTYILKEEQISNCYASYGTFVHKLLQQYALGELEIYELLDRFVEWYDENVPEPFPTLRNGKYAGDAYYEDGVRYFTNFEGFGDYKVIAVEDKFEIQIEDFCFSGIIDLLLSDDEGNLIINDHKSKSEFKDEDEERKYRRQLYLYAHYVKEKYGKFPSMLRFNMFRKQIEREYKFNIDDYNEALRWSIDTVKKIRQLYAAYSYFGCNQICGHREECAMKQEVESNPYWKQIFKKLKTECNT